MKCVPRESWSVEKLPCPGLSRLVVLQIVVGVAQLPSTNWTDPVGVLKMLVTVAVNVTLWSCTEGLGLEDSVVEVPARITWCWVVPELAANVPVGFPKIAPTAKATVTGCVGNDGSGLTEVICVVESAGAPLAEAVASNVAFTASEPATRASTVWTPAVVPSVQ